MVKSVKFEGEGGYVFFSKKKYSDSQCC
jgi:hypothetical protein